MTSCAQQNTGRRPIVSPFTRMFSIVTMKLIAPKSDDVMMITMPISQ